MIFPVTGNFFSVTFSLLCIFLYILHLIPFIQKMRILKIARGEKTKDDLLHVVYFSFYIFKKIITL